MGNSLEFFSSMVLINTGVEQHLRGLVFVKSHMCGLLDDPDVPKEGRHRELHQSHIKKSKAAVLKVVSVIQSFTNP